MNPLSRFVKANQSYCMRDYDKNRAQPQPQPSNNFCRSSQHYGHSQYCGNITQRGRSESIWQYIWRRAFRSPASTASESLPDPQLQFRKANDAEDCISLLARTHLDQIEIYLSMKDKFAESLCGIFPQAVIHFQGQIETGPIRYEIWSPYYSVEINKQFSLEESLKSAQNKENPGFPQILDSSIPSRMLEPSGTRTLKVVLDVSIEWSGSYYVIPIQMSTNSVIKNLYENDVTKDFTIVVGNGTEVKCHSVILAGRSAPLTAMISSQNQMKESQTLRAEMKDISEEGVNLFLRYLYGMPMNSSLLGCDIALELMQLAERYELTQLEADMRQLFLQRGPGWYTPDVALEVYFYVINLNGWEKLGKHALRILHRMPAQKIRTCERYQELTQEVREDLIWKLYELK